MKTNIAKKVKCCVCNTRYSPVKMKLIKAYARWDKSGIQYTSKDAMICNPCQERINKRKNASNSTEN